MFSFRLYKVDPCYLRQPKLARSTLKAGTREDPPYEGSQLKTAAARQFGPVHRIPHGALVDGQTCGAVGCRTNSPYHYTLQANYKWARGGPQPYDIDTTSNAGYHPAAGIKQEQSRNQYQWVGHVCRNFSSSVPRFILVPRCGVPLFDIEALVA